MNKAFLVALREYMENLKTKAFWIGIMAFPVILALMFLVPMWMEKKKDVRKYVVVDKSGWLLEAVENAAALPDMRSIIDIAVARHKKGGRDFEKLPAEIKELAPEWAKLPDDQIRFLGEAYNQLGIILYGPKREFFEKLLKPEEGKLVEAIDSAMGEIKALWEDNFAQTLAEHGCNDEQIKQIKYVLSVVKCSSYEKFKLWWDNLPPDEAKKIGSGLAKGAYERIDVAFDEGEDWETRLKKMINEEKLFAYFVISNDPAGKPAEGSKEGSAAGRNDSKKTEEKDVCKYVSKNITDTNLKSWFSRYANKAVSNRRIEYAKIPKEQAEWIKKPLEFESKQISKEGEESAVEAQDKLRQWAPVAFVYLLWISVFTITQMLLTNTIEEKSNKIMEVLLSSVSPLQLMAGKILGIAGTGLTMVCSWIFFFFLCIKGLPLVVDKMPDFDLSLIARDPIYIGSFVAYFILGYFLLAAILVGIGSVCNSLKEAQNLMAPVTIILIVPLLAMVPIGEAPNGTIAKVLSYIPPFTPFVMMNRAAGPPTTMEYVVTTILLVVSIAIALWCAAKIFRVGILMTGKPPKFLEILRWIKAPVGHIQVRKDE